MSISEWMMFFSPKGAIVQQYQYKNKLHFDEMMMVPSLYLTNTLSLTFILQAQQNNSPLEHMQHQDSPLYYELFLGFTVSDYPFNPFRLQIKWKMNFTYTSNDP
jgi:hypothetical protein